MFEFSKRESAAKDDESASRERSEAESGFARPQSTETSASRSSGRREAAIIGPSIHINGDLRGEEDLIIEGEVKGTVYLKSNSLTVGSQGKVTADVYAHTINVDGFIEGDLYGSERISIRKSAQLRGNITSPRVSLEDGARFKGSIEMDPEALQKVFGDNSAAKTGTSDFATKQSTHSKQNLGPAAVAGSTASPASGKTDTVSSGVAAKGESVG